MPNGDSWNKKWWIILVALSLITVLSIGIIIKVYEPPVEEAGPQLVIEDEHWASWMPIDNGFTYEGNPATYDYWNGVLVQLGRYWKRESGTTLFFAGWVKVVIDGSEGEKELNKGDFDWLNVVSSRPGAAPPLGPGDVGLLYPDPGTTTVCSAIDVCAQPYVGSGEPCVCATPPCEDESALTLIPPECLRLRSIHSHFLPEAVITYWQGTNGYKIVARQYAQGGKHNQYTFHLKDRVQVTAYKDGAALDLDFGDVRKITVLGDTIIDHGEVHDPGLDGGEFGPPE